MRYDISPDSTWAAYQGGGFGTGFAVCQGKTLVRLYLPENGRSVERRRWLERHAGREAAGGPVRELALELEAYFAGEALPEWPLDLGADLPSFTRRVLEVCRAIPAGRVLTYRQLAEEAGNARASRAAGNAMATNPLPLFIPCHRVVPTGGGCGNYGGGPALKQWLLEREGARF